VRAVFLLFFFHFLVVSDVEGIGVESLGYIEGFGEGVGVLKIAGLHILTL
jgi:hypothetical protein